VVTLAAGAVALVPFPFSDLSQAKLRPAVVLANVGHGDWILCQVTSNPYGDQLAIEMTDASFDKGSLRIVSYARPGKLFTANRELIVSQVATLSPSSFRIIIESVIKILRSGL
jgi:mRNA interferase MazF